MVEKDKAEPVAIQLRDIETGQNVGIEVLRRLTEMATGMGLDIRLGHLLPMAGKPYLTHEGTKFLMLQDSGPGISKLTYEWPLDDFANQRFVCKCTISSRDGKMVVEGEGDAFGVPVEDLKKLVETGREDHKKADSILKKKGVNWFIKEQVRLFVIKNVSSQVAINLASRRMAQTRAYNRAARMMLKISLPTVEEIPIEEEVIEGSSVVLSTKEQVAKIMEFHKSEKPAVKKLFEQHLEYGKPEDWPLDVANKFIQDAMDAAAFEVQRAKKEPAKTAPPAKDERGSLVEKDYRQG